MQDCSLSVFCVVGEQWNSVHVIHNTSAGLATVKVAKGYRIEMCRWLQLSAQWCTFSQRKYNCAACSDSQTSSAFQETLAADKPAADCVSIRSCCCRFR